MNTTPPTARPSGPAARRKRDTTLLWAIATFAVLVLGSALLLLMLATGGQLPTLEQGPSWTPPAVAATPAGGAVAVERPDDQPYLPGDVLQNVSGGRVNLRQTPGFQSKPAEDVIAVLQAGEIMTVLAGPEQADGLRWWRVRFNEAEGWMAERSNSGKLLLGPAS
jgi:hypothetical protein